MFAHCSNFTVNGGTFNVWERPASPQSDFRTIRAGDLNLLTQVGSDETIESDVIEPREIGTVIRKVVIGTRKVYRARIFGSQDPMTAIVYEGSQFDKWRAEAERRHTLRSPLILQLFGVTASRRVNALIYHDELISVPCFREMYRESPLTTALIEYQVECASTAICMYFDFKAIPKCTAWIRISTGRLCIDIDETAKIDPPELDTIRGVDPFLDEISILPGATDTEDRIRSILQLDDIHKVLKNHQFFHFEEHILHRHDVQLGRLAIEPYDMADLNLHLPLWSFPAVVAPVFRDVRWYSDPEFRHLYELHAVNGWTRVTLLPARDDFTLYCSVDLDGSLSEFLENMWLPQANWCIKQFLSYGREIPNESIYLCNAVFIDISIQHPEAAHDTVSNFPYLFLNRPTGELVDGQIFVRIPPLENLFYWSFDTFGRERLDSNWADEVLPQVVWKTTSYGPSWTSSQYQCLREVHKARGFDPDGPDVAISMGYPLLTPYNNESYFEEYDDEMDEAV